MSAPTIEPHPKFATDFLLSELFRIIDWDYAINFYETLASAMLAMTDNETLGKGDAVRLERLKAFFLAIHHEELGVSDKVKEMVKPLSDF